MGAERAPKQLAKCGIDCGVCPWGPYPRKSMTTEEFEQYKMNAKRILGFMPIRTPCVACQTPDTKVPKESKLPNRRCLIRQCVDKTGIANCAYCSRFPCDTVEATAGVWNRRNIEEKLDAPISEEEYHIFVEPFEGIGRLKVIHSSLKPEEIVEPARAPAPKTRVVDFPEGLPFSREETASFRSVHSLLGTIGHSSLGLKDPDTFAQQHTLENRKAHVLRCLWILGRYGKFENSKTGHLVVDAESYESNRGNEKRLAIWPFVKDNVIEVLSEFGVSCGLVALEGVREEDLLTGTGYLRSRGWVMTMSFEEDTGGIAALKALHKYAQELDGKYGKKAFQHFADADMQILIEK